MAVAIVVERFITILVEFVEERAVMVLGLKDDLKRLQEQLESISNFLEDAEQRRLQDPAIDSWLVKLKDAMYDADDIIELCRIKGGKRERSEDDQASASTSKVLVNLLHSTSSVFSFVRNSLEKNSITSRIKDINNRVKQITEDRIIISKLRRKRMASLGRVDYRQTSPLIESCIVGTDIEIATESLVDLLGKHDDEKCSVVAIVGMGGIGKTTLAQKVFADQKMHDNFSSHIWICVSRDFSETDLLKEIMRGLGTDHSTAQSKAELLSLLAKDVTGKSLFLVLDDVWHDGVWVDLLKNLLRTGVRNKVLVTTRDANVARKIKARHIHQVQELSIDSSWELLCKNVFHDREEDKIENLFHIGKQIVSKCQGLPLAIKAIAGVLITKDKCRAEWEKVLRSDAWSLSKQSEELKGALYLSYLDLPSHLKQCFLYFSLFPEDYEFYMRHITILLISEGFVRAEGDLLLEDIAKEYLEELIRRSILQTSPKGYDNNIFVMHDLFRCLAQSLSKNECFFGDTRQLEANIDVKLRRVSLAEKGQWPYFPIQLLSRTA